MIVNKGEYYIFRKNEISFVLIINDLSVVVTLKNQKFIAKHCKRLLKLKS